MRTVLDASAMIAFVRNEPGAPVIREILVSPDSLIFAHAANLHEFFKDFLRPAGEEHARRSLDDLLAAGVRVREDMDRAFWTEAALLRNRFRMSMADSFGLVLAGRLEAEFVTADHHELDPVAASGSVKIRFFR